MLHNGDLIQSVKSAHKWNSIQMKTIKNKKLLCLDQGREFFSKASSVNPNYTMDLISLGPPAHY